MAAFILENGMLRNDPEAIPMRTKQRARKWAPKRRTGCLTCRQRHVKCDEAKPACRRCVIASRDCIGPGYLGSSSKSRAGTAADGPRGPQESALVLRQPNLTVSPAGVKTSEKEMIQFYFFRKVAALSMAGVFDQKLCSQDILQATSFHPTVWHASCALAAMYQREALAAAAAVGSGDVPAKMSHTAAAVMERHDLRVFALEQYNTAIGGVLEIMKIQDLSSLDLEVLLTTTLLFTAIASLQGDMPAAMVHVINGQRIWQKWKRKIQVGYLQGPKMNTQQPLSGALLTPSSVAAVLGRLVSQSSTIRVAPWSHDYYKALETPADIVSDKPFHSPSDAYYEFEPLSTAYAELRENNKFLTDVSQKQPSFQVRCAYQTALTKWVAKFDKMRCAASLEEEEEEGCSANMNSSSRALNEEAVIILQARQLCMEIEILRDPAGKETTWDEFNPRFAKIVSLGERLVSKLRRQETGRVFSFSSSMMDAFFLTGTYCRHYDIRRRALKLLKKHNAREGMCNSRLAYAIALAWAEIEEAPGEAKLRWADNGIKVIGSSGDEVEEDCECEARVFICNDHRVAVVAGEFHAGDMGTMTYWTHRAITRGQAGEFRSLVW